MKNNIVTKVLNLLDKDLLADISEFSLDYLLDDGTLKDFPVIGTIIGIFKTANNISDRLYLKYLLQFLTGLEDVQDSERSKMLNNLSNKQELKSIGNNILHLLNNISDERKPSLMGKAFANYINNELSYEDLDRIRHVLNRCFLPDLEQYAKDTKTVTFLPDLYVLNLSALGLFEPNMGESTNLSQVYTKTDFGEKISKILFD